MSDHLRARAPLYILIALFILGSLLVLDVRSLVAPDEGRYAEMAREMLLSGDWVTTRLNGIKYFEKPPLHAWMSALSFALFGVGEWQARLWNAVCGAGTVLLIGYTGGKVFGGRAGLYGAIVLGSMVFWTAASQFNTLDIGVAATMTLALCALLLAQRDDAGARARRNWMLLCWAAMALSLLAKGLIGLVLPGAVLVLYFLFAGDRAILRRLHPLSGLAVLLLIALPWFLLVAARNPEQPHFFFIHEHWDRFFLKTHHREGPWYYFLVLLLPATLPWLPLLPVSLAQARHKLPGQFQPALLLLIWVGFILFFFSYSKSKLPGYMLPVLPAMAMLMGATLERAPKMLLNAAAALLALAGAGILAAWLCAGMLNLSPSDATLLATAWPLLVAAGVAALLCALGGWYAARRGQRCAMVLALALGAWLLTQLAMSAYEPFGRHQSGKDLALMLRPQLTAQTPVYSVGTYEQSITFYLAHSVIPVRYTDELEFGLQQEPDRGIATMDAFYARWMQGAARGEQQFALVRADLYQELLLHQLPMRQLANNDRVVVIAGR
ncbi:phospholipid carrier-dependent glycosyltransferase [Duganella sp. FT80W]|uniref:Phospholipid carrier-dependent glycosyltransferase n=1 Tax=Duganella guangzhouensis TaxID=2666084 RepID=A0A6I2KZL9_9BURK|nr:glycosyltransferase family 39 protein [Duganella guangzhouensis]MRW89924.1 phospholipid carrier-dependent glycosyltransferase [Duganella guangzhouensis]